MLHLVLLAAAPITLGSQLVQISALVGIVLPLLVAVVQREHWPPIVRTAVGVTACVIASIITAAAEHKLNWTNWAASATTIFLMTMTTYRAVWRQSGVSSWVERKTTRKRTGAGTR